MQVAADSKKEDVRDGGGYGEVEGPEPGKVLVEPLGQLGLSLVLTEVLREEGAGWRGERLLLGAPVVSQEHQPVPCTPGLATLTSTSNTTKTTKPNTSQSQRHQEHGKGESSFGDIVRNFRPPVFVKKTLVDVPLLRFALHVCETLLGGYLQTTVGHTESD